MTLLSKVAMYNTGTTTVHL